MINRPWRHQEHHEAFVSDLELLRQGPRRREGAPSACDSVGLFASGRESKVNSQL